MEQRLFQYCRVNNLDGVNDCLSLGVDVNSTVYIFEYGSPFYGCRRSALMIACHYGNPALCAIGKIDYLAPTSPLCATLPNHLYTFSMKEFGKKKQKKWSALVCQPPKVQKGDTRKYRNILSYSGPCCPI